MTLLYINYLERRMVEPGWSKVRVTAIAHAAISSIACHEYSVQFWLTRDLAQNSRLCGPVQLALRPITRIENLVRPGALGG